ncbi:hypothetical protein EVAR_49608_1 [Eumeta japonica]|uniref:Peptidase M10 metallopeptidase domain-containing protein n=1 Tax=Eumeta variegata TaxID=151549 RepID=A0A4C1XZ74_EUMVA|nr:hypothetical protein EVAR_49608_1 [Eumeta japonica]
MWDFEPRHGGRKASFSSRYEKKIVYAPGKKESRTFPAAIISQFLCCCSLSQSRPPSQLDVYATRRVLARALDVWQQASRLTFTELNSDEADIVVSFAKSVSNTPIWNHKNEGSVKVPFPMYQIFKRSKQ